MKIKLEHTLAALGLFIAALTFSSCSTGSNPDSSHNMGNPRTYRPMPNSEMPNPKDRH